MKDILQNIIQYTAGLGNIDLIKIIGTDKETVIHAAGEDKTVIVTGTLAQPVSDFIGTFGMPNLGKLKTILSFDLYDENAIINVTKQNRDGVDTPTVIHFETQAGDFVNDYRLMGKAIVEEKVKSVSFKGATWGVEFEPSIAGIQKLKKQAQANSEETTFTAKTENGDLKFFFGDPNAHAGNFVFQAGVSGSYTKTQFHWPVQTVLAILALPGDKKFKMSEQGASMITVDSGLIEYNYILPAQTK